MSGKVSTRFAYRRPDVSDQEFAEDAKAVQKDWRAKDPVKNAYTSC